jgi:hypothetical protein
MGALYPSHKFISKILPGLEYMLKKREKELKLLLTSLIDWAIDHEKKSN